MASLPLTALSAWKMKSTLLIVILIRCTGVVLTHLSSSISCCITCFQLYWITSRPPNTTGFFHAPLHLLLLFPFLRGVYLSCLICQYLVFKGMPAFSPLQTFLNFPEPSPSFHHRATTPFRPVTYTTVPREFACSVCKELSACSRL